MEITRELQEKIFAKLDRIYNGQYEFKISETTLWRRHCKNGMLIVDAYQKEIDCPFERLRSVLSVFVCRSCLFVRKPKSR